MRQADIRRIVVGVEDSFAGLRALRVAVAMARSNGAAVHAVRVWARGERGPGGFASWFDEMERIAANVITAAFAKSMGGRPDDLPVVATTLVGSPGPALVDYAYRDDDLLVVGATGGWWPGSLRPSVPRYCVAHARCPVVVVPADVFARQARRAATARAIRRDLAHLAD